MKELSFEKMEEINGGGYCDLICAWYTGASGGYQGSWSDLAYCALVYCDGCPNVTY